MGESRAAGEGSQLATVDGVPGEDLTGLLEPEVRSSESQIKKCTAHSPRELIPFSTCGVGTQDTNGVVYNRGREINLHHPFPAQVQEKLGS